MGRNGNKGLGGGQTGLLKYGGGNNPPPDTPTPCPPPTPTPGSSTPPSSSSPSTNNQTPSQPSQQDIWRQQFVDLGDATQASRDLYDDDVYTLNSYVEQIDDKSPIVAAMKTKISSILNDSYYTQQYDLALTTVNYYIGFFH